MIQSRLLSSLSLLFRALIAAGAILACVVLVLDITGADSSPSTRAPGPDSTAVAAVMASASSSILPSSVSIQGAAVEGDRGSRVALIEYGDFSDLAAARFSASVLPILENTYVHDGRVLFAFHQSSLSLIDRSALIGATSAECAGRQGRYWEMYDLLFRNRGRLLAIANDGGREIGLNREQFDRCASDTSVHAQILRDAAAAQELGLTTLTFFIGALQPDGGIDVAERVVGAQSFGQFQSRFDRLLVAQKRN